MKKIIFSFFCLVFLSTIMAQTTVLDTFAYDGLQRNYQLYIPQHYNGSTAVPLVVNMHGRGSNAGQQDLYGDFHTEADTDTFLVVHPNSTVISGTETWNSSIFAPGSPNYVDDVGFLNALIDTMIARYNIDTSQIFATGMSNGGFMSYTLACELSHRIKKIASVTGSMTTLLYSTCNPGRVIPVLQIHGTADAVVPYNGTTGMTAIDDVIDFWVQNNNCNSTPLSYSYANINTSDNSTTERFTYYNSTDSNNVLLYKVTNGGHTWPNAIIDIPSNGNTNRDFDASEVIWKFFKGEKEDLINSINTTVAVNDLVFKQSKQDITVVSNANKISTLEIYNMLGNKVNESAYSSINVSLLNSGVYILLVRTNNGVVSKSFIRQ